MGAVKPSGATRLGSGLQACRLARLDNLTEGIKQRVTRLHAGLRGSCGNMSAIRLTSDLAPAQMPLHYYFCREVATNGTRNALRQYALPMRRYLGPTSMDAEVAFLMCNQARVRVTQRQDPTSRSDSNLSCTP